MRLLTRQEIAAEYRIPVRSVDARMAALGVFPYSPAQRGRGHSILYDADEVETALINEREKKVAAKQKRKPVMRQAPSGFFQLPYSKAKELLLTGASARQ